MHDYLPTEQRKTTAKWEMTSAKMYNAKRVEIDWFWDFLRFYACL